VALQREDRDKAVRVLETILQAPSQCETLSATQLRAVERAREKLHDLDRPRLEWLELIGDYVKTLTGLVDEYRDKDPELARRCAERILRVMPNHARAREVLGKSGPPVPEPPAAEPEEEKPGASEGEEIALFNGRNGDGWSGFTSSWPVIGRSIVATIRDSAYSIIYLEPFKGDFTLIVEMRRLEDFDGMQGLVTLCIGQRSTYDRFNFRISARTHCLTQYLGSTDRQPQYRGRSHSSFDPTFDVFQWNRYEVQVRGRAATFRANGKEIFKYEDVKGAFDGEVAIAVQNCKVEIRKIAVRRP
jgi:hypothetical protein